MPTAPLRRRGRPPKLTPSQVYEIRALAATGGWTYLALARRFGVHPATISNVLKGRTWTYLPSN
jgi:transposase